MKMGTRGVANFALILFIAGVSTAYAQEAPASGLFIVRPAKVELTVAPGESETTEIVVANGTPSPLVVEATFEDVDPNVQSRGTDEPFKLAGSDVGSHSLKAMFSVPKNSFELLSGKEVRVPVTITVPRDIDPGGRFGTVIFRFHPVTPTAGKETLIFENRIAALFFVRVEGKVLEEGKLARFGVFNDARFLNVPDAAHLLRFQIAYENTGTVHLNPYGRMMIVPLWGDRKTIIVDPYAVLPGATRMREVALSDQLHPGYYRAHLELNRGYGDIVDEADVIFWIIPGTGGLIAIVIIFILFLLLIRRSLQLSRHFVR